MRMRPHIAQLLGALAVVTVAAIATVLTVAGVGTIATIASVPVGAAEPWPVPSIEGEVPDELSVSNDELIRITAAVGVVYLGGNQGTGWVAADGTVVTNFHVARNPTLQATFIPAGGARITCWVAAADRDADLAALRCPDLNRPALPVANRPARRGEPVIVVGYPKGLGPTLTAGNVRETERRIREVDTIGFTAVIQPGSSGSPVLAADGSVLAVATFSGGYGSKGDKLAEIIERAASAPDTLGQANLYLWLRRCVWMGVPTGVIAGLIRRRTGLGHSVRIGIGFALLAAAAGTVFTVVQLTLDGPASLVS